MTALLPIVFNIIAVSILTFGLYLPRHRRRDLIVAYLGVNFGVLAVAEAFTSTNITAGLGLGLFGVLSIIRLRSVELDQHEIAYYFVALALGVLGGVPTSPLWLAPVLMAALLAALFVGDHGRLLKTYRSQRVTLDRAITDEGELWAHLEDLLGAKVHRIAVRRVDLVNDTTDVDVRFEIRGTSFGDARVSDARANGRAGRVAGGTP
ncbi:DUF4956 domain-containing protein [Candidatus Poriferisodalis sp.]|uniref:DUF4956 domain-containing protein n=1 Tax=Candidatus Poriferisodalis sp. TaxID=3101277 RepID=UPI003B023DF2